MRFEFELYMIGLGIVASTFFIKGFLGDAIAIGGWILSVMCSYAVYLSSSME